MRRLILAALLTAAAPAAFAEPTPKAQLLVPPANAAHFVVVSTAGKHGDEYLWTLPDGRIAFRQSILLRGLVFENVKQEALLASTFDLTGPSSSDRAAAAIIRMIDQHPRVT